MQIPRWLIGMVVAPLLLAAVFNGVTAYYQVQQQQVAINKLQRLIATLPTPDDIKYIRRRLTIVENKVTDNSERINTLAQAIAIIRAKNNGLAWHPPLRTSVSKSAKEVVYGDAPRT